MADIVECQSGHDYADRPVAITWNGQRLLIESILDRWRIPDGRCFRVETDNKQVFKLTYLDLNDEWEIYQP